MAIRRLSYRLGQEPDTGAVSLVPPDPDSPQLCEQEGRLWSAVARVMGVPPAGEAGSELSYSLLPDGGRLLCAALPGQRVEALHLSADTPGPGPVWPIDTWRSESWQGERGESLGSGFVESELPVPEAHFDRELLVAFARERADRVAPFLADVRRLFEDPAGRQIVLVEDDSETVARWIALACASLPEAYVSALTFTTWTDNPRRAPQRIIGIGPEAEFDRSDDAVVEYLYRVHDGTGGGPESPATEPDAWARLTAERWLTGNPPRPPRGTATDPEGPFALIPLVAGALLRSATERGAGGGEGAGRAPDSGVPGHAQRLDGAGRAPGSDGVGGAPGLDGVRRAPGSDGAGSAQGLDGTGWAQGPDDAGGAAGPDGAGQAQVFAGTGGAQSPEGAGRAQSSEGAGRAEGSEGAGRVQDLDGTAGVQAADAAGRTPDSGAAGHAPGSGVFGHAPGSGAAGHAPGSGAAGHAPGSGVFGHAPSSGAVGHAPDSGAAGHAPSSGVSGHAPSPGVSGHAPSSGASAHAPSSGASPHAPSPDPSGHAPSPDPSRHARRPDHSGPAADGELGGLRGDTLRAVLDAFTESVTRGEADARTLAELDRLCRGLDGDQALAARPLALALVKHRLDASRGRGTLPDLASFDGLPLGQEAWRELREEYGDRADDALRARLRDPVTTWTEPLRLALAVGADGGTGLARAMDRLAEALLHPERRDCAQAVHVLSELDHVAFTRRVLRHLLDNFTERKLDRLRALADSPQGDWLRRNIDDAPLTVRLAAAAAQWHGPPDRLRGVELFERLTGLLSARRVEDVKTLNLLWRLVWRNDPPNRAEQPRVARLCTPRLIIEADLGRRIMGWLKEPDHCDRELVAFAREMRQDPKLGAQDRDTAELLVIAQDLADGRLAVDRASVGRLRELKRKVSPLGMVLGKGVDERVGRALAAANPLDVCESGLRILVAAGPDLLGAYRAHLLEERARERLERELPSHPTELAAYYHLWRPRRRHGVTAGWRDVAAELLDQVLAPVLAHLDDHRLGQVATVLHREGQDVQEWTAWRHRVAGREQQT
ncbi:GTPase-associated protein 1-related protein [Streptomyces venezuelae]|uniref:GTPase-associated protein 1-related protein n=1 Tax=Streptomyces venezuelae TaxID=54571 RepID=UPI003451D800